VPRSDVSIEGLALVPALFDFLPFHVRGFAPRQAAQREGSVHAQSVVGRYGACPHSDYRIHKE